MSDIEFAEQNTESAVCEFEVVGDRVHPSHAPQKARSLFADQYDVPYADCRAKLVEYLGTKYVIVGEIDDD